MQQVFAESWPFRSTGYIVARIHIHRTNLICDEIHHHLFLASVKCDAMTNGTIAICDNNIKNMQQDRSFVILSYWRPCVPGHWQTIGIKTPKMIQNEFKKCTGNRICTSKSKVCSKSLWPSSKMQHPVQKHMFFFPFGAWQAADVWASYARSLGTVHQSIYVWQCSIETFMFYLINQQRHCSLHKAAKILWSCSHTAAVSLSDLAIKCKWQFIISISLQMYFMSSSVSKWYEPNGNWQNPPFCLQVQKPSKTWPILHRPPSHLLKRLCCWSQRKVQAAWASEINWSCVSCWDLCHRPPSLSIIKHKTSERHICPKAWKVKVNFEQH